MVVFQSTLNLLYIMPNVMCRALWSSLFKLMFMLKSFQKDLKNLSFETWNSSMGAQ
jgi:hypothetical protein